MLVAFIAKDVMEVETMANLNGPELQAIINDIDDMNLVGQDLHAIATELNKPDHEGVVPSTKKELSSVKVDDNVAALLLQQVFGSTELVVGLHARKLVCALDMFDWEESGATKKQDVKMVKVPAE